MKKPDVKMFSVHGKPVKHVPCNSGMFSHGTKGGRQKLDPTASKFQGNQALLASAVSGHKKTMKSGH